jgi:hypothetical protein
MRNAEIREQSERRRKGRPTKSGKDRTMPREIHARDEKASYESDDERRRGQAGRTTRRGTEKREKATLKRKRKILESKTPQRTNAEARRQRTRRSRI